MTRHATSVRPRPALRFYSSPVALLACVAALTGFGLVTAAPAQQQPPGPVTPGAVDGKGKTTTTDTGKPVGDDSDSLTAGPEGPTLLQDFYLIEKIARFDRERIPERVVHARGAGVHGEFVASEDCSAWTKAKFLGKPGKSTPMFVRFSTVVLSKGSADTARDVRGFATKFYTEEGNYDLVGNDIPVFFIRDAIKFPDLVHSLKPSPVSNVQESERFFDFFSATPESTHMLTFLFADDGTPASFRQINGFGVHAFKWVNAEGKATYVKYHWKSKQGTRYFTDDEAKKVGGVEPAYLTKELYDTINAGKFPSWDLQVQLATPEEVAKFDFNALDATKDWPTSLVPRKTVGTMTLNRVPNNFFEATEQVAFNTGAYVPGIEPSEDKLLQGRNFSYSDTQRHRLGPNYQQLPINRPVDAVYNVNQDGLGDQAHRRGDINYNPSTKLPAAPKPDSHARPPQVPIQNMTAQAPIKNPQNFKQAGERIRAMSETDRDHLLKNLTGEMKKVKTRAILVKQIANFHQADEAFARKLAEMVGVDLGQVKQAVMNE